MAHSAREQTPGSGLQYVQSWTLATDCRGQPASGGWAEDSWSLSPKAKLSRHLQGWLKIPILANGARSTSQGQTQEVSDTFLIFHSLEVPNSRK